MTEEARVEPPERRTFLGILGWIFIGIIGLFMGLIGSLFAIFPAFKSGLKRKNGWHALATLDQIPEGQTRFVVTVTQEQGWSDSGIKQAVWVVRQGNNIEAFSAVCPHAGCTINHEADGFICLCHISKWRNDGQRVAGPTPRDMDKFNHRITDGKLEIYYEDFKQGVDAKTPMES